MRITMMAADERSSLRRRRRRSRPSFAALAAIVTVLAVAAFLLVPTGHLNSRSLVQVNGFTYSLPPAKRVTALAAASTLLARPGSKLDLTGDVVALGEGAPARRELNGAPLVADPVLEDGSQVLVRQGEHRLEGIKRKSEAVPFETTIKGSGVIVSLVQAGTPGLRVVYKGTSSGKQAAVFTVTTAQNAVVQRSTTAKSEQRLAALTFDDGPGTYTQAVLDALAGKHVSATFFVLGSSAAGNQGMIKKIKAAGHEVENHTWSHPILTQVSPERLRSEISRTNEVIGGSRFLRPPYGTYDAAVAAQAGSMGLRLALWTVDTLDWKYPSVDSIMSYVKAQTKPGAIILMHDGGKNRSQTVAAIPVIVDWLFANGYSLTTVEKLL
ncbi:MAG: polysaccharide deacetylase family protein [bacterium]